MAICTQLLPPSKSGMQPGGTKAEEAVKVWNGFPPKIRVPPVRLLFTGFPSPSMTLAFTDHILTQLVHVITLHSLPRWGHSSPSLQQYCPGNPKDINVGYKVSKNFGYKMPMILLIHEKFRLITPLLSGYCIIWHQLTLTSNSRSTTY